MIAVFVREKNAIQLFDTDSAKLEPRQDLARAETAVNQEPAMIGRDECTVSGTATAEHGKTKHVSYLVAGFGYAQTEFAKRNDQNGLLRVNFSQSSGDSYQYSRQLLILPFSTFTMATP